MYWRMSRAHLARRDHWWKPLGFALLAVYWFNPVLWLAYTLLCRDIELACDERVIRTMDESAVKTYSTVLLACSMPRKAVITCPLAFGEVGVKERVRNALHYKSPRSGWSRRRSPCASLWRCAF
ncbi:MAG: M56 family metallopeptidase [Ruminococcus sp.]|uniref:M56 family metallopeptidase n=1 Tax=Ruminococcus sp. TaxID=41978 RepID=UPI0039941677